MFGIQTMQCRYEEEGEEWRQLQDDVVMLDSGKRAATIFGSAVREM